VYIRFFVVFLVRIVHFSRTFVDNVLLFPVEGIKADYQLLIKSPH